MRTFTALDILPAEITTPHFVLETFFLRYCPSKFAGFTNPMVSMGIQGGSGAAGRVNVEGRLHGASTELATVGGRNCEASVATKIGFSGQSAGLV